MLESQTRANIRALRALTGATVQEMASALRISVAGLRRKLNGGMGGGGTIALRDIERIAAWAGMDPYDLLRWHALDAYRREYLTMEIRRHLGIPAYEPPAHGEDGGEQPFLPTH